MAAPPLSGGLNPQAPEYIPLSHYIFVYHPIYQITHFAPNNYQPNPVHHFPTTPPPPPAFPITTHQKPENQEFVKSNQEPRFGGGGACRRSKGFIGRTEGRKENNKFGKVKLGNEKYRVPRVVQSCVMQMREPKPVLPLLYCEGNNDSGVITTVMIRNIPNKLTRGGLLVLLDNHCMLMNQISKESGDHNVSAYDFLYLPMDFKTGVNKGYAFVNFTNKKAVRKFHTAFHNKKWDDYITPKITEIVCAKIQGKKELEKHFGNTMFICESDDYLPLSFKPARDGCGKAVEEVIVGKRSSKYLFD